MTLRPKRKLFEAGAPVTISAVLIVLPVLVANVARVDIPLTDVGILLLVAAARPRLSDVRGLPWAMRLALIYSLIAIVGVALATSFAPSALAGFAYYFRALAALIAGSRLGSRGFTARQLVRPMATGAALFSVVVMASLMISGQPHLQWGVLDQVGNSRTGLHLNGLFVGLPLWGSYGVNSLAVYYAVAAMIIGFGIRISATRPRKVFLMAGFASSTYLAYSSGSRQALALVLAVIALAIWTSSSRSLGGAIVRLLLVALTLIGVVSALTNSYALVQSGQTADQLSTGRITIFLSTVDTVADAPIFGTGFQTRSGDETVNVHNTPLSVAYRAGLPAAILATLGLVSIARQPRRRTSRELRSLAPGFIIVMFVGGMVADLFALTPVLAPMLVLLGVGGKAPVGK